MATIPTDFDQLAHAIAFATVHSDIEVYTAPPVAQATAPAASIQILIEWLSRRFGAVIDAGELPKPVVTAVREVERWLNPLLPMPEAPR